MAGLANPSDGLDDSAARRIEDLEGQVSCLSERTAHMAESQNEILELHARLHQALHQSRTSRPQTPSQGADTGPKRLLQPSPSQSQRVASPSRFRSFFWTKDSSRPPAVLNGTMSPAGSDASLQEALNREIQLRKEAESKLHDTTCEIEELTASLFSEANEMVAAERMARAKLENRVEMLEKRDQEKRARLHRLEQAVVRVGRVKSLLADRRGSA
ncbi:hypothetical protein KEM52_003146 [Ascosphaera acerosa]|nr:hypothetical protein KEM52_003146 [Ascosphaera acerosa]